MADLDQPDQLGRDLGGGVGQDVRIGQRAGNPVQVVVERPRLPQGADVVERAARCVAIEPGDRGGDAGNDALPNHPGRFAGGHARFGRRIVVRLGCGLATGACSAVLRTSALTAVSLSPFIPRGWIFDYWSEHDYDLPVHPATLCIRREWLMATGGWMAMPYA
ncbi:hypothetical protein [Nocardia sp. NPDC059239]|uniref:hypothetical protein n=1 Tax=Nocardia sp. NPDC059239 TaxID=3346785 RepID=UPI0036CBDFFB